MHLPSTRFRLTATAAVFSLCGCATNPATGERQLALISESQEVQMGREAAVQVRQTLPFVANDALQDYVRRIGLQLAANSERPKLPWEFHVVDDPTPNAFALPGGFIYITRGMLNLLTSEAELAGVLGHEIGHVTARHSVSQISQQQLAQVGLGLGGLLFPTVEQLSPFLGAGLGLLSLKYSRDDERQADELGLRYMTAGDYAAAEFADAFVALQRSGDRDAGALPGWLSTHPTPAERVETARARAAQMPPGGRVDRDAFLRRIDGVVYGRNPRDGFFRETRFYHPELRFQMQFPQGWQTQNLAQAVIAASPDGRAVVELTLAQTPNREQALQQFAAQRGLQVGPPRQRTINGLPAVSAEFAAQAEATPVRGIALFVEHRGRVYQILGYSAANVFGAAEPSLVSTLESFDNVTDAAILNVQPNRIDIVQVPRNQTLAEFATRFPSVIPIDQMAVINHVGDGSAPLQAGLLVKRVVEGG